MLLFYFHFLFLNIQLHDRNSNIDKTRERKIGFCWINFRDGTNSIIFVKVCARKIYLVPFVLNFFIHEREVTYNNFKSFDLPV